MIFDYNVIWASMPLYLSGMLETVKLLGISLFFGLLAAVPLGLMRVSKQAWVNFPAWLFTYVIRGTPMLVQLFLIYYGLAQFEVIRDSFMWPLLSSATFCACLAFAINTSAYTAEIIAGSLRATPNGEIEAAKAMGMSRSKMYRRILLPSAMRRALPQYSNEVIMMLQTTSLASIVTLIDITGAARTVNAQIGGLEFQPGTGGIITLDDIGIDQAVRLAFAHAVVNPLLRAVGGPVANADRNLAFRLGEFFDRCLFGERTAESTHQRCRYKGQAKFTA